VSRQQAHAELEAIAQRLPIDREQNRRTMIAQVLPLKELIVGDIRESLLVFAGSVAFVLLIACANVANLFLARAGDRSKEIGVAERAGCGAVAACAATAGRERDCFVCGRYYGNSAGVLGSSSADGPCSGGKNPTRRNDSRGRQRTGFHCRYLRADGDCLRVGT